MHQDVFEWCLMYGYMVHFDPKTEKKARNYYECCQAPQLGYLYEKHKIEYYTYYNKDEIWSYNIRDPDNCSYSWEK